MPVLKISQPETKEVTFFDFNMNLSHNKVANRHINHVLPYELKVQEFNTLDIHGFCHLGWPP